MREDKVEEWPEDEVKASLGQAPEQEGKFIKVKRILQ
jgi:Asp-tRNA(Asn)/Glu-tRNA(Gln) amidotransferase C subunit